jgi:hypothetical protein
MRKDIIIGLLLFILAISIRLPLFGQPHVSDPLEYVKIAENVFEHNLYSLDGKTLFNRKPPLFIYSAVFFNHFTNNIEHAVKVSAIFWGSLVALLTYFFARNFKLNRNKSIIISLIVMFNPWLYYTGGGNMAYPEGMLTCFVISGLYFYKNRKKNNYNLWIAAITFSLAALVKTHSLMFTVTFMGVHVLYSAFERKKFWYIFHWKNILLMFIIILGELLFTVRNLFVTSNISNYYGLTYLIKFWPYMMVLYIFFMIPLLLLFSLPQIYFGARKMWEKRFWKTFLISFGLYVIFLSVVTHHGTFFTIITSKVRYLLILFPYLIILGFMTNKPKFLYNWKIISFSIIGTILFLLIVNFGAIQLKIDGFPITYQQKAHLRDWGIQKTNEIANNNAYVVGFFVEPPGEMRGSSFYLEKQLRSDLNVVAPNELECIENSYIISELKLIELSKVYPGCNFKILENNYWMTIYGVNIQ